MSISLEILRTRYRYNRLRTLLRVGSRTGMNSTQRAAAEECVVAVMNSQRARTGDSAACVRRC